jgi:hypothetical protein
MVSPPLPLTTRYFRAPATLFLSLGWSGTWFRSGRYCGKAPICCIKPIMSGWPYSVTIWPSDR